MIKNYAPIFIEVKKQVTDVEVIALTCRKTTITTLTDTGSAAPASVWLADKK